MTRLLVVLPLLVALCACPGAPVVDEDGGAGADGGPVSDAGVDEGDGGQIVVDGWRTLPAIAAGPRQEIAVLALGREVFVVAGYSGFTFGDSLLAFNVDTEQWREAASLPVAVHHPNAAVWGGHLFVLGTLGSGFDADGAGWRYDPDADRWSSVPSMPGGTERGAALTLATDDRIWVVGGYRGGAVAEVSAYDPLAETWTAGPSRAVSS